MDSMRENTTFIRNIRAYTLAALYYEFVDVGSGEYTVKIIPAEDEGQRWSEAKTAGSGAEVISGVAADANGEPVEGATVVVTGNGGEWTMVTEASGEYSFEVPSGGEYTVSITYPASYDVSTDGGYENDPSNPIQPVLDADSFTIYGFVHDTDGNVIEGADVRLQDDSGNELDRASSDFEGRYAFDGLRPGKYVVVVLWNGDKRAYPVDTSGAGSGEEPGPDEPKPPVELVVVSGVVVTGHKRPLPGAVVTVRNMDSGAASTLTADSDGRFTTGELERGRYEIQASYTHKYGTNVSDPFNTTASQDGVALVIVLSYSADVNGDGQDDFLSGSLALKSRFSRSSDF